MSDSLASGPANAEYWDRLCAAYQRANRISVTDFHYGPLLPGDRELGLLPADLDGKRCLELGGGAGQNSIVLAGRGADCTALDISPNQLAHGRRLAAERGVQIDFVHGDLDGDWPEGDWDLVHTTYALPFSDDPARVIRRAAERLAPGGVLLVTTAHPLFAYEWMEFDDGERGLFVPDYFHPPVDARVDDGSDAMTRARAWPVEDMFGWFRGLPLRIADFREPRALPIPTFDDDQRAERVPYYSEEWVNLHPELDRVPVVCIFKALGGE